jgi:hypothetical protein
MPRISARRASLLVERAPIQTDGTAGTYGNAVTLPCEYLGDFNIASSWDQEEEETRCGTKIRYRRSKTKEFTGKFYYDDADTGGGLIRPYVDTHFFRLTRLTHTGGVPDTMTNLLAFSHDDQGVEKGSQYETATLRQALV